MVRRTALDFISVRDRWRRSTLLVSLAKGTSELLRGPKKVILRTLFHPEIVSEKFLLVSVVKRCVDLCSED